MFKMDSLLVLKICHINRCVDIKFKNLRQHQYMRLYKSIFTYTSYQISGGNIGRIEDMYLLGFNQPYPTFLK